MAIIKYYVSYHNQDKELHWKEIQASHFADAESSFYEWATAEDMTCNIIMIEKDPNNIDT